MTVVPVALTKRGHETGHRRPAPSRWGGGGEWGWQWTRNLAAASVGATSWCEKDGQWDCLMT
jgi:hypothetical protein